MIISQLNWTIVKQNERIIQNFTYWEDIFKIDYNKDFQAKRAENQHMHVAESLFLEKLARNILIAFAILTTRERKTTNQD